MQWIQSLVQSHLSELTAPLTEKAGFDKEEAQRFVPVAADEAGAKLAAGGLDLGSLLGGGGLGALIGKLDVGAIARGSGVDPPKAEQGLQAFLPVLIQLLGAKAGGAQGLASLLGGGGAGVGGMLSKAGKLFGR